jgi:ubiquinone/menaquinone biosynthesis C-methylase UbiE
MSRKFLPEPTCMAEITNFTQADTSPAFFIDFLEFLDNQESVKTLRAESFRKLNVCAGHKVLDVGCGIGGATIPIGEITGPTGLAAGVDLSSAMIEHAIKRAANQPWIKFHVGDACSVPYPDDFFDLARSERLFLYLPDRIAAIKEMIRVVKPGGRIYLVDTDVDSTAIYSQNRALTRKMTSVVADSMPNPNSGRELPALARKAGLRNLIIETSSVSSRYEFFLRAIAGSLIKAAETGVITQEELREFLEEQAALHASGDFFQMRSFVRVTGTV